MKRIISKVNWETIESQMLGHAIVESLPKDNTPEFKLFFDTLDAKAKTDKNPIEVELIVNGVPLNASKFFEEFERQTDRMIRESAKELIQEKFTTFETDINRCKRVFKDTEIKLLNILKVKLTEDERWELTIND